MTFTPLTGPDQGEAQGIAGESRIAQGVLDGTAPASGPVNGGTHITLTCLCSHFAWNPKCPIHKPAKR